ncbi:Lipoprotein signal peptidase [Nocardioides sp. PD653]|nr:Lipoprotein signal peptidase [Nocardioides sp. PD653-B2]GAW55713.1 Lipoprotein signal peptidase [Nocardioides sp. PD653]
MAIGVAALDLLCKQWALQALAPLAAQDTATVRLGLVRNPGVALSLGAAHPMMAGASAAIVVGAVAWWLARSNGWLLQAGLAAMLGGGVGNLADRVHHGAVTDWIHVAGYPATFNLADVAIRLGALTVLLALWLGVRQRSRAAAPTGERPAIGAAPHP